MNLELENAINNEKEKEEILDTDNDGIPDDWEINGYTVENKVIVKWDDTKHKDKGFIKYFSDPYDSHTTGDPYSDAEKILGKIDGLKEACHPMVAAYPKITVEMERIIISKNITESNEEGKNESKEKSSSVGFSTNNSHTDSTTIGASITTEVHASLLDFGASVSVSANFSNESSNTVSHEENKSDSSSESFGTTLTKRLDLNQSEVAFLNGNIRYTNIGTMPIYNLRPTLNFVLGLENEIDTIATISAKVNTLANVVLPNQKYPVVKQNALAWNTSDDFNSQPIKLNYEQVKELGDGKPLQIQATQVEGQYKEYSQDGKSYSSEEFKWSHYFGDIYRKTALLTIAFNNDSTFERRVAAVDYKQLIDPKYPYKRKIPQLTIREALKLAFNELEIKDNVIFYQDRELGKKYENLNIVFDNKTIKIINAQLKDKTIQSFLDVIITSEMKILFVEPWSSLQKDTIELTKDPNFIKITMTKKTMDKLFIENATEEQTKEEVANLLKWIKEVNNGAANQFFPSEEQKMWLALTISLLIGGHEEKENKPINKGISFKYNLKDKENPITDLVIV